MLAPVRGLAGGGRLLDRPDDNVGRHVERARAAYTPTRPPSRHQGGGHPHRRDRPALPSMSG